jgi:hypothetical protein
MNTTTPRDIRIFVAGALAFSGFESLTWLPGSLAYVFLYPGIDTSVKVTEIITSAITVLALPLGLGIFFGKPAAICWAKIYLWFFLIIGFITVSGFLLLPGKIKAWDSLATAASEMVNWVVLLWLLSSPRFQEKAPAQSPAPDPIV